MGSQDDFPPLPHFPLSLEPHELLEILLGELRTPLDALEGWAGVLGHDPALEGLSLEAVDALTRIVAYLRAFLGRAEAYLDRWQAENDGLSGGK